jgi:hypothetical protein
MLHGVGYMRWIPMATLDVLYEIGTHDVHRFSP